MGKGVEKLERKCSKTGKMFFSGRAVKLQRARGYERHKEKTTKGEEE